MCVTKHSEHGFAHEPEETTIFPMKRDKRKQQVRRGSVELPYPKCVYCGRRDGTEREHVIASSFFDKPFPAELPKVPACGECNRRRGDGGPRNLSDDEAYVRDRICMQLQVDDHVDGKRLFEGKVLRNLTRPESHREREAIVASMQPGTVELEPDVYLCGMWSFQIDLTRFERVMGKIVRGLCAFHLGERMPDDYAVVVLPRLDQDLFERARTWIEANDPSPLYRLGINDTVCYRYASTVVNPLGNNWLVTFYQRYAFYAHTGPERGIPANPPPASEYPAGRRDFPVNNFFTFD